MIAHVTNQQTIGVGFAGQLQYAHLYEYGNMSIVQAQVLRVSCTSVVKKFMSRKCREFVAL